MTTPSNPTTSGNAGSSISNANNNVNDVQPDSQQRGVGANQHQRGNNANRNNSNSRNRRNRNKQGSGTSTVSNGSTSTFKGNTSGMQGHVFQTYTETQKRGHFLLTMEALQTYAAIKSSDDSIFLRPAYSATTESRYASYMHMSVAI